MNVLSLFSGVGGFDLGLENAGMKTIYQCEWDKHATRILEQHWPTVPRWGDISTLTAKEILRHGTPPDVVAWGSPCQDLSVAGKRAGLEGERSGLFHEGIRIINELRKETNNEYPKISIWENVAGALSSNRGADFGVIIDEMAKAGAMVIEWGLLDAQHFGIPQRRRRVFCIAIFNSATATNCPNPLLPIGESLRGNPKKGKPKRKSSTNETSESLGASGQWAAGTSTDGDILRTSITSKWSKGSAGFSGSEFYNMVVEGAEWWDGGQIADALTTTSDSQRMPDKDRLQAIIVGALAARDYKGVGNQYVDEGKVIVEPYVKSRRAQSATDDETWVPGEVNPTLNSFDVGDTRATTAIIEPMLIDGTRVDDVRVYEPPVQTLGARMGTGGNNVPNVMQYDGYNQRLYQDDVALTIRIGRDSSDFIAQPTEPTMAVRRLTPLECERLMGWPDDHTRYKADGTEQADTHRYKQCGNGVASPVAEWIGKQLMKLDEAPQ